MVAIGIETYTAELAKEIIPLGQKCWDESTAFKGSSCAFYGERDFLIEPDTEQYQKLADQKALVLLTLRDGDRLQGYAIGILYRSLHQRNVIAGNADSCYIEPEYRSYTPVLIERFEKELKARGAVIVGWAAHVQGPLYSVLKARGYVGDDLVMEKRLCVLQ